MWIVIVIILIVLLVLFLKFRSRKKAPIILYSGRVGGGKSFSMTSDSTVDMVKSYKAWKHVNKPFIEWLILWIPYFNKKRKQDELYGIAMPELYSNYPIRFRRKHLFWGKWELSKPLTLDILLLKESVPLNSIFVWDEVSGTVNQFEFNENFSPVLNDHIQKWRHYHGNLSHLYLGDQCTNNIPIQLRYRCNSAICCLETKHYGLFKWKFIHITSYKQIDLTDAIKSVEIIDNDQADTDDKVLRFIRFSIKRKYDDRAYSNRYWYVDENVLNSKYIVSDLKVTETLNKPDKKEKFVLLDDIIKTSREKSVASAEASSESNCDVE